MASPPPSRGKRRSRAGRSKAEAENARRATAAQEIIAQARSARADRRGGEERRQGEGQPRIVGAKAEIEQEVPRAKELREQVAALAVAGAEKILRREVDAKAHADLLERSQRESEADGRADHRRTALRRSGVRARARDSARSPLVEMLRARRASRTDEQVRACLGDPK